MNAVAPVRLLLLLLFLAPLAAAGPAPVYIGMDAEFGHRTSTSDDAVRAGIRIAVEEINAAGGVLGGRPLALLERDNRSVPARGVVNLKAFAEIDDLVAVFSGKFSPVVLEELETIHRLRLPLLDPWAAANKVIDNGYSPNYVFRLSLRDSWAVPVMLEHLRGNGARRIGVMLPNTAWGRSNEASLRDYQRSHPGIVVSAVQWYNWGDDSLLRPYQALLDSGMDALLLVANEQEGSVLLHELAERPMLNRVPIASHWGVTGGDFFEMTRGILDRFDFAVVQTYSFIDDGRPTARRVAAAAARELGVEGTRAVVSPVGVAHAYDLTHILARALDLAGTTERAAVRDALERVSEYHGLIKHYPRPFSAERHEGLAPEDLFMARYEADGALVPIRPTVDRRNGDAEGR